MTGLVKKSVERVKLSLFKAIYFMGLNRSKVFKLFIVFLIVCISASYVFAEESPADNSVVIKQNNEVLDIQTERHNGRYFIKLRDLSGILKAEVEGNLLKERNQGVEVAFFENSRIIKLNGADYVISAAVFSKQDNLYVPVKVLSELFGITVESNEQNRTISLDGSAAAIKPSRVDSLFPRYVVRGTVTKDATLYDGLYGKATDVIKANTAIEILADKAYKWYHVKSSDGRNGWVSVNNIYIDPVFKKNMDRVSNTEIEQYIKLKGWTSPTEYMLWTDISRQKLYVLKNVNGWKVYIVMDCSTGENISPTIQGEYSVSNVKGSWLDTGGGTGAKYFTRFYGAYYFHSIKLSNRGKVLDATLGMPASMGCIRLSIDNSKWVQDNIPTNTKIYIY